MRNTLYGFGSKVFANKHPAGILKTSGVSKATSHNPPLVLSFTKNLFFLEKTRPFWPLFMYFPHRIKSLLPPKIQIKQPLTPPIKHQKKPSIGERNATAMPVPTKNLDEDHKNTETRKNHDPIYQR